MFYNIYTIFDVILGFFVVITLFYFIIYCILISQSPAEKHLLVMQTICSKIKMIIIIIIINVGDSLVCTDLIRSMENKNCL